jgi:aldose 1-epimerase
MVTACQPADGGRLTGSVQHGRVRRARGDPMTETPPASGRQIELRHGAQSVTVVEVGGGIRAYTVGGVDILDGYDASDMCVGAKGQTLLPWPNRIEDGQYEFDGESFQLPLTEAEAHNAIHGLVRWHDWAVDEQPTDASGGVTRARLTCRLYPSPGYPFTLDISNDYTLDDGGLTVRTTTRNAGPRRCPYAVGFHPYLRVPTDHIDEAVLRIPSGVRLPTNDRGIPTGREDVTGTGYDFRQPRPIGDIEIDTTYADLDRDADGRAEVTLATPDGDRSVTLWLDQGFRYVEIFTGDTLPEAQRRCGLGVEPMTCPPNAYQTGEALLVLEPGEEVTTTWGIRATGF